MQSTKRDTVSWAAVGLAEDQHLSPSAIAALRVFQARRVDVLPLAEAVGSLPLHGLSMFVALHDLDRHGLARRTGDALVLLDDGRSFVEDLDDLDRAARGVH